MRNRGGVFRQGCDRISKNGGCVTAPHPAVTKGCTSLTSPR